MRQNHKHFGHYSVRSLHKCITKANTLKSKEDGLLKAFQKIADDLKICFRNGTTLRLFKL